MTISERQNSELGLRLLRAAQVANARVARIEGVRTTLSVVLVVLTVIFAISTRRPNSQLAIVGSCWAILSVLVMIPAARRWRGESCTIQEQFDTYVFDIPWNQALGSKVDAERIHELSDNFRQNYEIADWYPDAPAVRPLDVMICQRANVSYDIRLRTRWRWVAITFLTGWIVSGFCIGAVTSMTVSALLVTWFCPSCAAILLGYEIIHSQNRALRDRTSILPGIDRAIEFFKQDSTNARSPAAVLMCRTFQDAIYDARKHSNRVPGWFYRLRRTANESIMRTTARDTFEEDT